MIPSDGMITLFHYNIILFVHMMLISRQTHVTVAQLYFLSTAQSYFTFKLSS